MEVIIAIVFSVILAWLILPLLTKHSNNSQSGSENARRKPQRRPIDPRNFKR